MNSIIQGNDSQRSPEDSDVAAFPTIESCIGNTPLVRLQRLGGERGNTILVKLEGNNPAGSVKDRPALNMINAAEQRGDIKPGDTLIEATSGNTGLASAMAIVRAHGGDLEIGNRAGHAEVIVWLPLDEERNEVKS